MPLAFFWGSGTSLFLKSYWNPPFNQPESYSASPTTNVCRLARPTDLISTTFPWFQDERVFSPSIREKTKPHLRTEYQITPDEIFWVQWCWESSLARDSISSMQVPSSSVCSLPSSLTPTLVSLAGSFLRIRWRRLHLMWDSALSWHQLRNSLS